MNTFLSQSQQTETLESRLHRIARDIQNHQTIVRPGLYTGHSGLSLFYFYYARYRSDEKLQEKGLELLEQCFEQAYKWQNHTTFCDGLSGMGWALAHLNEKGYLDTDVDEALSELDHLIGESMVSDFKIANYDFLHGLVGKGLYFLKRKSDYGRQRVSELVDFLHSEAEKGEDGSFKWKVYFFKEHIFKYNISLSHGLASFILFAAKAYAAGINPTKSLEIVKGGIQFLLKCKITDGISVYPGWMSPENEATPTRVAWCYGDLGIALALYQCGKLLKEESYIKEALELFLHTSRRREFQTTMAKDASVCHGGAGNALIFHYMYLQTNEPQFKDAAEFWLTFTLDKGSFEDGIGGYKYYKGDKWANETNLLTGSAGIGLSLLAFLDPELIDWSECLMIG